MERAFLETSAFMDEWQEAGLTDEELRALQADLLIDPKKGDVIRGAGGIRKLRVGMKTKGRRDGGRLIYKDFPDLGWLVLIYFYRKSDKAEISSAEKTELKHLSEYLAGLIRQRFTH